MNFIEIIKGVVLQVINNLRFTEVFIGEVIDENNLKIKLNDKIILTENQIIRTLNFNNKIKIGTKILILREQGGQRYYLINTIFDNTEEGKIASKNK